MRYIVRSNATPKGQALVRMIVETGSLDEADDERGYAHFVEHMAFNGSTNVPEGEMVKLLERLGLAFGADTNASTGFDRTTYMLDLPRNDPALLDTALMLMRETASELTISEAAVERERGVILAERRDRNTFALRNVIDQIVFQHPGARYTQRLPIGTEETLNAATAARLRAFWRREYVPAHTTVIVIGAFAVETMEAAIKARFADWQPAPAEPQPKAGPLEVKGPPREDLFIDQALAERVTVSRNDVWLGERDSLACCAARAKPIPRSAARAWARPTSSAKGAPPAWWSIRSMAAGSGAWPLRPRNIAARWTMASRPRKWPNRSPSAARPRAMPPPAKAPAPTAPCWAPCWHW